jgi:hypothetical protein
MTKQDLSNQEKQNNIVDLVIFMGQSNMAGRGNASECPNIPKGVGYEFRAISDPTKLYDIAEPFGVNENNPEGIYEPGMKTGSLVSSFILSYYQATQTPIVSVSASKGGSSINQWQPGGNFLEDTIARLNKTRSYLLANSYAIRKTFMVWCQGETDGDNNMSETEYKPKLKSMIDTMFHHGIEVCFIIRIGNHRDNPSQYDTIKRAQANFCNENEKVYLISTKFDQMAQLDLMKDPFHYYQPAYNMVGTEAGSNAAKYIMYMV